jgi:hypothetical protein
MQKKYGDKELAVLAVTIDDPRNGETRTKNEKLLTGLKTPFRTLDLDGYDVDKMPTLNFGGGVPGVFVFNRENRYVLKLPVLDKQNEIVKGKEFSLDAIDKAVAEAIKR